MSQKYIHCSWDILEPGSLIPRIPKSRVIGPNISEDDSTPRICVADTVQRALMAMPGTGKIIKIMQKYKVPVIIHAYYLEQDWKSIRRPRKNEVPDVELTGECWMLKPPISVMRRDYLVKNPVIESTKDLNGTDMEALYGCMLKPVTFQSNFQNFLDSLTLTKYVGAPDVMDLKKAASSRTFMMNMDEELYQMVTDAQTEKLWAMLTDIPFDEDPEGRMLLSEDFALWKAGMEREDIWEWFDENHSKGVGWMMEHNWDIMRKCRQEASHER